MIDLHCHSIFSDGLCSPSELVSLAVERRVKLLALTDHDTVSGLDSIHSFAKQANVSIIDGIELSVHWKKYDIHIIGLAINREDSALLALIKQQTDSRRQRAQQIGLQLTAACGIDNAYLHACDIAGHDRVGRAHFAKLLMDKGITNDFKAGFKRFLGRGRAAYVASSWISLEAAVSGIVKAGGQAVIAHPMKYKLTRTKLDELVRAFKEAGGQGIEVVSGETTPADAQTMAGLSNRFDLLASTGSDFHGHEVSRVALGQQRILPASCKPIWDYWGK